jgi:hypothetical protein
MVYFVTDRHNSKLVSKTEVVSLIADNIDKLDLAFWDENFNRVIEITTIDVLRVGEVLSDASP